MKTVKTLIVLMITILLLVGCNTAPTTNGDTPGNTDTPATETEVTLRRGYYNPHGTKSFSRVALAMAGDKILAVNIEEYQIGDVTGPNTFVPNFDKGFGEGLKEGFALYSKRVNNDLYSKNMEEKAGATMKLVEGYKAIEDFAKGKTVAELEAAVEGKETGTPLDAISSSTLVDTVGYIHAIIDAAKNDTLKSVGKTDGNVDDIKLGFIQHAAHGDKSFADTVVAVLGDKIVAANIDEFQFLAKEGSTAVPNSDAEFGENYAEDRVLASKKVNNESYSKNMADKAGATKSLVEGYTAIENHVVGLTVSEVEALVKDNTAGEPVDAIANSTLVDTVGYLESIALAAKNLQ